MIVYNEIEPFAVEWLRNLAAAGHIPPGTVVDRPIQEIAPDDVRSAQQFHTFCGIGGWPLALRLAGWPATLPVWTGSAPCQPFSVAGLGGGVNDPRHLWPAFFELIKACRPPVIMGEQVASADGRAWLDAVCADLEAEGYTVWAADLAAAGVGAPHIRQRLYFVAWLGDAHGRGTGGNGGTVPRAETEGSGRRSIVGGLVDRSEPSGSVVGMADPHGSAGGQGPADAGRGNQGSGPKRLAGPDDYGGFVWLGSPSRPGPQGHPGNGNGGSEPRREREEQDRPTSEAGDAGRRMAHATSERERPVQERGHRGGGVFMAGAEPRGDRSHDGHIDGPWSDLVWLPCRDGKARPTQRGLSPLAAGLPRGMGRLSPGQQRMAEVAGLDRKSLVRAKANRTGRLKGYGNAIVPPLAVVFIRSFMETMGIVPESR